MRWTVTIISLCLILIDIAVAETTVTGVPATEEPYMTTTSEPVSPISPDPSNFDNSSVDYDYGEALRLSILFYDAQRSGKLPANNPIPWRGDSALYDGEDVGLDLTGGWFDAGDHVKFNLPMAFTSWMLNWGFLQYKDAYEITGLTNMMCDTMRTPLDYFLKCWLPEEQTLYAQVGDGDIDHQYWRSPETMEMPRPAYQVNATCPGSDVAGDMVSALASGYLVYDQICGDKEYAQMLLDAAESLYGFATENLGSYTDCVPGNYYLSSGYEDELAGAAVWMYKATGNETYLVEADKGYRSWPPWSLDWDGKSAAVNLLMYGETQEAKYESITKAFIRTAMPGGNIPHTPCGLLFRIMWGANRHAANFAFIALTAAKMGIEPEAFSTWGLGQINYILGDNPYNISYEVGFGDYYPTRYHHRGSSCRMDDLQCDINTPGPNPNLLNGALAGGPSEDDTYEDERNDYVRNEVAVDYNAGFQGALAALVHFATAGELPPSPPRQCYELVTEPPTTVTDFPPTADPSITTTTEEPVPAIAPEPSSFDNSSVDYDYGEALRLSILFYDAQRSGKLPADNPIPWRGDSALYDGEDVGLDLTGGWFDAGDHVKFNLPMAYSTWILNMGFLQYEDAYEITGLTNMMCDTMRTPLDYFLKCWLPEEQTLYVQVGDGDIDHQYWRSPETMTMPRPAYHVNTTCPGSDVAGDMTSALASGYLVYDKICGDKEYAQTLLDAAESLYSFASENLGIYTECIPGAYYKSSGYEDELAGAAVWMYKATGNATYLDDADQGFNNWPPWSLDWDGKAAAVNLLMYEETQEEKYENVTRAFIDAALPGGDIPYTPAGLLYRNMWGANRHAANFAFVALTAAQMGIETEEFKDWGMGQIHYILGDNPYNISYEVGFSDYYPTRYHHRGSSCQMDDLRCDINAPGPNPNLLNGALAGGPSEDDAYEDDRNDYVRNEVALDYNAGFQGALAALVHFASAGVL